MKNIHRTVYLVEVFSDEEIPAGTPLMQVAKSIDDGDNIGRVRQVSSEPINAEEAARIMEDAGMDPGFFQMDAQGKPLEGTHAES